MTCDGFFQVEMKFGFHAVSLSQTASTSMITFSLAATSTSMLITLLSIAVSNGECVSEAVLIGAVSGKLVVTE